MPDERTSIDIKSLVKEIAANNGFDEKMAVETLDRLVKEKCYDVMAYQPYGGATSFEEIDTNLAGMEYSAKVSEATYALQGIISNITHSDDIDVDEKTRKMSAAVDDYKTRVTSIRADQGKSIWDRVKEHLGINTPRGPQEGGNGVRDLPLAGGFKVYTDANGDKRWLSLSSNAFEDLDKELFTTSALQEAIDYADKTGERGPLLVYHVPSAEIGQCDYQAMAGRFLVESGTFNDTPLGRKALEYFENTDEEHQVSIGFQYRVGDETDGQFDWLRITERSTTPNGAAANPWTDFKLVVGDSKVNEQKAAHLRKMFGDELAEQVIASAEAKTKDLEQSVRFKETKAAEYDEKEFGEITDVEEIAEEKAVAEPLAHVHGNVKHTHRVLPDSEHQHQGGPSFKAKKPMMDEEDMDDEKKPMKKEAGDEKSTELAQTLASLLEDVGVIRDTVTALDGEVKALKQDAAETKERENNKPRYSPTGGRPTDNADNVIGSKDLEDILQQGEAKPETNPAFAYVQDLLHANGAGSSN